MPLEPPGLAWGSLCCWLCAFGDLTSRRLVKVLTLPQPHAHTHTHTHTQLGGQRSPALELSEGDRTAQALRTRGMITEGSERNRWSQLVKSVYQTHLRREEASLEPGRRCSWGLSDRWPACESERRPTGDRPRACVVR